MPAHNGAPFRRTYLCAACGNLRRADGSTPARQLDPPSCCGRDMINLMHEQAVAATQLTAEQRVKWMASGGRYVRRGGKRPWKAVMRSND